MSERGAGFGPFLLGLGVGAVLGFLFAPEPGEASRSKLSRKLRGLRDLAAEKANELFDAEVDEEDEAPTARVAVERRLIEAKRRRRGAKGASAEQEDEPVA
jgi:gas vesicle protein